MPIAVNCLCGQVYHVRDEFAGQPVQCDRCGRVVTVPPTGTTAVQTSTGPRLRASEPPLALPVAQPTPRATCGSTLSPVLVSVVLLLMGGAAFLLAYHFDRIQAMFGAGEPRVSEEATPIPDAVGKR